MTTFNVPLIATPMATQHHQEETTTMNIDVRRTTSLLDEPTDYVPVHPAGSVEPFPKPDHKAKKRSKPTKPAKPAKQRHNEKIGGGHFVFRRNKDGRVHPSGFPFEHPNLDSAVKEAERLHGLTGDSFDVMSVAATIGDAYAPGDELDVWDRRPEAA